MSYASLLRLDVEEAKLALLTGWSARRTRLGTIATVVGPASFWAIREWIEEGFDFAQPLQ